ncbi:MAG: aminoglycoside phosphotransferase family protein [Spirochaetaceae bacterium]
MELLKSKEEKTVLGLRSVFNQFNIYGDFISAKPYGTGHINDTYKLTVSQGGTKINYLLQWINHNVFKNPEELMFNIERICKHQNKKLKESLVDDASRKALTLVQSRDGKAYVKNDSGYWRCYFFIEDALGYDIIETEIQAFEAARAFGSYQSLLSDLPGQRLFETIPDFHNTPKRFEHFKKVLKEDSLSLASSVKDEIDFFLSFESGVTYFTKRVESGILPERVTHNDTKLNNVLLDVKSGESVCIIDLDTSMPGLAAYDFGDLVRTSTCFSAEDENDLSKVKFQMNIFEALVRGYLSTAVNFLTVEEVKSLVFGGILMTYEVGLRFLTDYLEGNIYFKSHYPKHNLIRSRTQLTLVKQLVEERDNLEELTMSIYNALL